MCGCVQQGNVNEAYRCVHVRMQVNVNETYRCVGVYAGSCEWHISVM